MSSNCPLCSDTELDRAAFAMSAERVGFDGVFDDHFRLVRRDLCGLLPTVDIS